MKKRLLDAFNNPTTKFCYYTGQNNPDISKMFNISQWDWTPQSTINIEPHYWKTHTIPLAFGCKKKLTSEGNEWISPLITHPDQVYDIQIPDIYSGRTGEILNEGINLMKNHPEDVLIRLPDVQSPLGICELMWDQAFYLHLITNPDQIKVLLDKITIFIINYVKEFQSILGERYNPACHPHLWSDPCGYYISDDANSMVSPDMHMELSIDYINRITEELGPVFYHTCTLTDQYLENILKVKNMKCLNWSAGTSMDPAKIIEIFSGKVLLAPHLGLNIHEEENILNLEYSFDDEISVFKYFLDSMKANTTMNIVLHESLFENRDKIIRIYNLFKKYGYIPQF
jgi:hypothetical protein